MPTDYAGAGQEMPETGSRPEGENSESNLDTVLVSKAALGGKTKGEWELVHEYEDESEIRLLTGKESPDSLTDGDRELEMMAE